MSISKSAAALANYRAEQRDYTASFIPSSRQVVRSAMKYKVVQQPRQEDLVPDRELVARLNSIFDWERSCMKSDKVILR